MQLWVLYAILAAFCAALVAVFGKIGIKDVDPTLVTAVRAVIMAVVLVGVALLFGKFSSVETLIGRPLLFIVFSGLAGALSWFFYFLALKYGPASSVAALDRTSVVLVVLLAALFLGESLTIKAGVGAVLILVGALLFI